MQEISMIILAGGKSRRMGRNKADLLYKGRSFLEIQEEKADSLNISDVVISGYIGQQVLKYPVLPDIEADKGPLSGIITCLQAVKYAWALVLSVDAPLVPAKELERLIRFALSGTYPAAITQCGGRQYPLVGVYHRSLIPAMHEELQLRKGSVFSMLRRTGCGIYESEADPILFANVNDPDIYAQIQEL